MAENIKYLTWVKNVKSDIVFLREYLIERRLLTPELEAISNMAISTLETDGRQQPYETYEKYAQRLSTLKWKELFDVIHTLSQPTKIKL